MSDDKQILDTESRVCFNGGMTNTPITPLPDLDNDTLTHTFRNSGGSLGRTRYDIWRSINGGPEHRIGTVVKTRDSSWSSVASWIATSKDGETSAVGETRVAATRSLEYRLQGPEYADRKRAEYEARRAAEETAKANQRLADAASIDALIDAFPVIDDFLAEMKERSLSGFHHTARYTAANIVTILNTVRGQQS